jgi:hypothetical protein
VIEGELLPVQFFIWIVVVFDVAESLDTTIFTWLAFNTAVACRGEVAELTPDWQLFELSQTLRPNKVPPLN